MNLDSPQRVHIAPQGYEEERIYEPAVQNNADIVVLLSSGEDDDRQSQECRENVVEELENEGITVRHKKCNVFDSTDSIQQITSLIDEYRGDDVNVNISTGSKITAISGMLACMLTDADPYYVKAKSYGDEPVTEGVDDVFPVPAYPIEPPEEHFIKVMSFIGEETADGESVIMKDINNYIQDEELDPVTNIDRSDDENIYDICKDKIISPLEARGHIDVTRLGNQKHIQLTKKGEQTLKFSRSLVEKI